MRDIEWAWYVPPTTLRVPRFNTPKGTCLADGPKPHNLVCTRQSDHGLRHHAASITGRVLGAWA